MSCWVRRRASVCLASFALAVALGGGSAPARAASGEGSRGQAEKRGHVEAVVSSPAPPGTPEETRQPADYDPWEPFNERTFWFNHDVLDRFVVKPVATVWDTVLPDPVQRSLERAFSNLDMPRRLVNKLLQARLAGAGLEIVRFGVNTTLGVGGLFDMAERFHVDGSDADTGQTLGVYGFGAGPYLVLPFLPPFTVRDGIGYAVDGLLDPLGYVLPVAATTAMSISRQVNDRSLNLQLYDDVEESVLDLYSAARNAYLQRRRKSVQSARNAPDRLLR